MKSILITLAAWFVVSVPAMAQETHNYRISFNPEWGVIFLPSLKNDDLYAPNSPSPFSALNISYERLLNTKSSLMAGVTWQASSLKLDAAVDADNRLAVAPDSVKYGSINQQMIAVPVIYRRWFGYRFLQVEAQFGYTFKNEYGARINRADKEIRLDNASVFAYSVGLGFGAMDKCTRRHLAYTIKIRYWLNPYFTNAQATKLDPLQLALCVSVW